MHWVLDVIRNLDTQFYYFLCRGHGNWFLDRIASHQESNNLFKSGLLFAAYWYFWFRKDAHEQERRRSILTIFAATFVGLALTRMLATALPMRVRPLYDTNLHQFPMSIPNTTNFMNWSSFPSDHAAYLGALAFGLIFLSRRLTIPVTLYLAGWVCLPRMYLGIHYASDIVVGTAIGVATVAAALRLGWIQSRIAAPVLAVAEVSPQLFYPLAYLVIFEMTVIFMDIRGPIHAFLRLVSTGPHHEVIVNALMLIGALCALVIATYAIRSWLRKATPAIAHRRVHLHAGHHRLH